MILQIQLIKLPRSVLNTKQKHFELSTVINSCKFNSQNFLAAILAENSLMVKHNIINCQYITSSITNRNVIFLATIYIMWRRNFVQRVRLEYSNIAIEVRQHIVMKTSHFFRWMTGFYCVHADFVKSILPATDTAAVQIFSTSCNDIRRV